MKVAIAYEDGQIGQHFGHATCFAIYNYTGADISECEKTLVDATAFHGHQQMADLMKDSGVDAVMSQQMGTEAKAALLSYGIVPVTGYQGDADTAADLLVTGQLPVVEGGTCSGGCGGGCGGCGGGCHDDEEGGCSCGCGCGGED